MHKRGAADSLLLVFGFVLTDAEMGQIRVLDTHTRQLSDHRDPAAVRRLASLVCNV